jgi:predicted Zn-dependent peptidase
MIACAATWAQAQDIKEFEKRISEFTLPNGLQFVVMEHHDSPAVSFYTYVRAGSTADAVGRTGLAYMLEEALFTGSETIGSKNWTVEKKALDAVETTYDDLEAERNLGPKASQSQIDKLQAQLRIAIDTASRLGAPRAYGTALEEGGGIRVSTNTTPDAAEYTYSLPSNKLELWFLLESQRLMRPSLRDFYSVRETVAASRDRAQAGQAQLMAMLAATAFEAHPYRNPRMGWPGDVHGLRRSDALAMVEQYYVPGNTSIAIVGDVNPVEVRRMAERYFGPWTAKPLSGAVRTLEPMQLGPKMAALEARPALGRPSPQLMTAVAYKRPSQYDRDDAALSILQIVLGHGKTALLQKELITENRLAQAVQVRSTFPAGRYPNLFTFLLVPAQGHTVEDNEKALEDYLNRLKMQRIEKPVIDRAQAQVRVTVVNRLNNNAGMAELLGAYQAEYGDWRKLFATADELNKVTAEDLQRVLTKYFVPASRTTVHTVLPGQPEAAPAGGKK